MGGMLYKSERTCPIGEEIPSDKDTLCVLRQQITNAEQPDISFTIRPSFYATLWYSERIQQLISISWEEAFPNASCPLNALWPRKKSPEGILRTLPFSFIFRPPRCSSRTRRYPGHTGSPSASHRAQRPRGRSFRHGFR